jgi:hypothetical protein
MRHNLPVISESSRFEFQRWSVYELRKSFFRKLIGFVVISLKIRHLFYEVNEEQVSPFF